MRWRVMVYNYNERVSCPVYVSFNLTTGSCDALARFKLDCAQNWQ